MPSGAGGDCGPGILYLLIVACFSSCTALAQGDVGQSQSLFNAGTYFDVPPPGGNATSKYLVSAIAGKADTFEGNELTAYVETALKSNPDFNRQVPLSYGDQNRLGKKKTGDALALYVSRAQHDEIRFSAPGAPDDYLTVISISIALDIFTNKAAERNALQLERSFSRLLVGEQPIRSSAPLDAHGLSMAYVALFNQTLKSLLGEVSADRGWQRERAKPFSN